MLVDEDVCRYDSDPAGDFLRFDRARFSPRSKLTTQGFVKIPCSYTRAGVFEYTRVDGRTVRELRAEEDVFDPESLATISGATVTRDHPGDGMVTPSNVKKWGVGFAAETVSRTDSTASGFITVTEKSVIQDVGSGKLCEISMGYKCRLDKTPGVHPVHGRYDQRQHRIRYNHVALGEAGWNRAGEDVGIRYDSAGETLAVQRADARTQLRILVDQRASILGLGPEALAAKAGIERWDLDAVVDGWSKPSTEQLQQISAAIGVPVKDLEKLIPDTDRADARNPIRRKTMEDEITIGGVTFTVPKAAAQAIRVDAERRDSEAQKIGKEHAQLQGRFDAQAVELTAANKKAEELDAPDRFDSAVDARIALEAQARKVLGDTASLERSVRGVQEQVLRHDSKDLDLKDKSDDYVEARFDAFMEALPAKRSNGGGKARTQRAAAAAAGGEGDDADRADSKSPRERMRARGAEAWKAGNVDRLLGR